VEVLEMLRNKKTKEVKSFRLGGCPKSFENVIPNAVPAGLCAEGCRQEWLKPKGSNRYIYSYFYSIFILPDPSAFGISPF